MSAGWAHCTHTSGAPMDE